MHLFSNFHLFVTNEIYNINETTIRSIQFQPLGSCEIKRIKKNFRTYITKENGII